MKKTSLLYCFPLFFLQLFNGISVLAQKQDAYTYQYFNTSNGLPSSEIISLAKDSKGFLWIGTTAGLSIYDGYNFENRPYTKDNEWIGLVKVIKPDADNRLWIGSGAGLFCYVNNEIVKISAPTSLPQGVNDILPETDGMIWLATENGPAYINSKEIDLAGNKKLVLADYVIKQWIYKNETTDKRRITIVKKAVDGTIYFAQNNNLFRFSANTLERIHSLADERDKILSVFPISKSLVYFDAGLTELNKIENGVFSNQPFNKIFSPYPEETKNAIYYAGTNGVFSFQPETGNITLFINLLEKGVIWPSAVLKEKDLFWVATHDGLIKIKPAIFNVYDISKISNSTDYYSILELKEGKLLLGANRGNVYEKRGNLFSLYKEKIVPSAEIKSLYEDKRGWLWAASGYQGLAVIRKGKTERFTLENGLHDNSLFQFLETSKGKLYVFGDQGVTEIIVNSDQSISFKKMPFTPNFTKDAKFFSAVEAPDGNIWFANEEGIVFSRNDSLYRFDMKGKQLFVNFLIKDRSGMIWIATSGQGIFQCVFNKKNELEITRQFTEYDGLNTLNYLTLLADKENNIWAGSSKGLSVIGQQGIYKDRILNFDASDGFIKPGYSHISLYQQKDSTIWAATVFGFASFKPNLLLQPGSPPEIFLTAIRQIKKEVFLTTHPFQQSFETREFSYADNSLSISFTALDYTNQENIRYYYQLEGRDTNWVNSGNIRTINFENLSPGKYIFKVKALNSKGIWSSKEAYFAFVIIPPFWQRWWFILLCFLALSIAVYLLIKNRESGIKKREIEKTEIEKLKAVNYQHQLEIEQVINFFASSISGKTTVDDMLWDVAKGCISKLGFEDCVIYIKDEKRNILVQKAAWGAKTGTENNIINAIEIPVDKGIVGAVAATGKGEIIANTASDSRYIKDDAQRLSEIAVPIVHNKKVIGVIDSEHPRQNFYTQRHLHILNTIASLCADKMDKINAEQQTREKELEVLKLSKDLATSQLTALRAQMNPHFIFNALNSIQQYILTGDVDQANKYLSKFSRLQRDVLNNSAQNFIPLEKEIEMLTLYLDLEQLRFKDNFTYDISISGDIDAAEIDIPPMILQPFVENAIWHGLMSKQGHRRLQISFSLSSYNNLQCVIQDNGIGRDAAARIREQSGNTVNHKSMGMGLVYERLSILEQQYQQSFTVNIKDIKHPDGAIQGTEVLLNLFIGH